MVHVFFLCLSLGLPALCAGHHADLCMHAEKGRTGAGEAVARRRHLRHMRRYACIHGAVYVRLCDGRRCRLWPTRDYAAPALEVAVRPFKIFIF